jgi:hypothetical protein
LEELTDTPRTPIFVSDRILSGGSEARRDEKGDAKKLKKLEDENRKLKQVMPELTPEIGR